MAIVCPRCKANFDVTLFEFGRAVRCQCGQWIDLTSGHTSALDPDQDRRGPEPSSGGSCGQQQPRTGDQDTVADD